MSYRYLGYGITDSNGEAKLEYDENGNHLDHSITGTGAGELDIVASLDKPIGSGSIVSETYGIWDTLMYDNTYTSSKWTLGNNITEEDGEGYSTFKSYGSNSSTGRTYSVPTFTGDIEAIFEANITYSGAWGFYFGLRNGSNHSTAQVKVSGWRYLKFRRVSGVCTAYISSDGNNWESMTMTDDNVGDTSANFEIYIYTGVVTDPRTVDWKNFKIYTI